MADEQLLPDVDHAALFSSASAPDVDETPAAPEPAPQPDPDLPQPVETSEPRVDASGRLHGADGKFASKAPADAPPTQAQPAEQPTAGQTPQTDHEAMVPSWRLRELREQREAAEARAQQYEHQLRAYHQQEQQRQQQIASQQQPQQQIDPLMDPQGYIQMINQQRAQERMHDRLEFNLQLTKVRHGEKFDEAFAAFMQAAQGNPHLSQAVIQASDPGDTLWQWYQGQSILREVGTDPKAYRQRLEDEMLKDPAFQARVIQHVNGTQQQSGSPRPANLTQLPPSLSKTTGTAVNDSPRSTPTGAELFNYALRS